MTPDQVLDRLMYSSYAASRDMGMKPENLIPYFDVETFEPIYRAKHMLIENHSQPPRCPQCGSVDVLWAGRCGICERTYQQEQREAGK